MRYSLTSGTVPAEPVTLTEAKLHLKVDVVDDDDLIEGLIQAAREWVENYCRRSLVQRSLSLRLDCFPGVICLPRGPVISLTSVKYTDASGNLQTVSSSSYDSDLYSEPARVQPVFGGVWPVPKVGALNSVLVTYEAGYSPSSDSPTDYAANVPAAIKSALKLHIQANYGRGVEDTAKLMASAEALLAPFEVRDYSLE